MDTFGSTTEKILDCKVETEGNQQNRSDGMCNPPERINQLLLADSARRVGYSFGVTFFFICVIKPLRAKTAFTLYFS